MVLVVLLTGLFIVYRQSPSCFDGELNQDELNVDCGGSCTAVCAAEVSDIIVLWSRVFLVRPGVYDVAALVENPNRFALKDASYSIKIHDENNLLVKEVRGSTYLNPIQRALIFESKIDVGFRQPTTAFITFSDNLEWLRVRASRKPELAVGGREIITEEGSTIRAVLSNESLFDVADIETYALVYDDKENVVAVSTSFVPFLTSGASQEISFTWPIAFDNDPFAIEILTRTDLVSDNILENLVAE